MLTCLRSWKLFNEPVVFYILHSIKKNKLKKKINLQLGKKAPFYTSCPFVATEIVFQTICFPSANLASILRDAQQL